MAAQIPGDCLRVECTTDGSEQVVIDDSDSDDSCNGSGLCIDCVTSGGCGECCVCSVDGICIQA